MLCNESFNSKCSFNWIKLTVVMDKLRGFSAFREVCFDESERNLRLTYACSGFPLQIRIFDANLTSVTVSFSHLEVQNANQIGSPWKFSIKLHSLPRASKS